MNLNLADWLHLAARWFHVILGITWIGQTYLFNWLERRLAPPDNPAAKPNVAGELWMVHSGGFYLVEKQTVPELMPRTLHWFKWESVLTWLSGMLLLFVVYYFGGALLNADSELSTAAATGLGLGVLVGGTAVYELLWRSPLGRYEAVAVTASFLLVLALAYALEGVYSGRGVYIHIGALFGTIMTANVWGRILPAQRTMLAGLAVDPGRNRLGESGTSRPARGEGRQDPALAARARRATKHNTYLSVPLVFIMISSHFPVSTYGSGHPWLVLGVLILVGWAAAKIMRG